MPRPKKEKPNRSDGRFEYKGVVGYDADGKPKRKSFYSHTSMADAKQQYEEYQLSQEVANKTGEGFIEKDITFSKWASKWLEMVKSTVRQSTFTGTYYNTVINHLIPKFGNRYLRDIKQIDIQQYFNESGQIYSLETLKKHKLCLKQIFESAIDNDLLGKSPIRNVKLVSKIKPMVKETYSEEDVARVLEYCKTHRFGFEIEMLLRLGMRRGELLGIMWDDIDFDNGVLHIRRAVSDVYDRENNTYEIAVGEPKTTYSVRNIPLPDDILDHLKRLPRDMVIGRNISKKKEGTIIYPEFVFHNKNGTVCGPATWNHRHYEPFMKEMRAYYASLEPPIEIKYLSAHELRHTCATLLVNKNKNLISIAKALGWANLNMLRERYAHDDIKAMKNELDM